MRTSRCSHTSAIATENVFYSGIISLISHNHQGPNICQRGSRLKTSSISSTSSFTIIIIKDYCCQRGMINCRIIYHNHQDFTLPERDNICLRSFTHSSPLSSTLSSTMKENVFYSAVRGWVRQLYCLLFVSLIHKQSVRTERNLQSLQFMFVICNFQCFFPFWKLTIVFIMYYVCW